MKIKQIVESSAGATASGSVASVASPLGATQARNQKPPKSPKVKPMRKGKKGQYGNSFESDTSVGDKGGQVTSYMVRNKETVLEGSIKSIATDMDELSEIAFKKKYGKSKEEMRKSLKEEKIDEADLIVMPGMRRMKDTSFIPHEKDRRDHEVEMARSELYAAAKDAMRIFKLLKDRSEEDGLMGWQQSYITLASDYLNSVADSIEYNAKVKGSLDEMTGGVLAGGMSNFEEGKAHKCPSCGGEMVNEELMNEKKDACYYKVKSRYKVWPSAYASGALVKCRKKGASNWGKSKK
jgi:hypothetical protein